MGIILESNKKIFDVLSSLGPDVASSHYYLFGSIQNALTEILFSSEQGILNLIGLIQFSLQEIVRQEIYNVPEIWINFIADEDKYFEKNSILLSLK